MTTLLEPAFAKVNLTLDVLGRRPDGYHDLRSVFQTVSVRDDLALDIGTGKPWRLQCSKEGIPCDERNLAWKAAKLFCELAKVEPEGLEIRITKRIPSEAGLGGGSADAAAVLRALNRHYGSPFSVGALAEIGAQVGSDVPFCVLGGTAMVEGRGERLRPLPPIPECFFVICKPDFSSSTPELYRQLDAQPIACRPDHRAMEAAILAGDLAAITRSVRNVFDDVVSAAHPEVGGIKSVFRTYGGMCAELTGSGSAIFTIVPSFEYAAVICDMLRGQYSNLFIGKSV
ncbi:MAG: 4-(cytidine 5'-diphospho)-2-C-methyl-D-erythritol kinase [Firmicutes bacterium]|nr:4-(cytidine 5'-diphospho)-2-C-methyl-D-erythritol kinase [Bacillota bacterium]